VGASLHQKEAASVQLALPVGAQRGEEANLATAQPSQRIRVVSGNTTRPLSNLGRQKGIAGGRRRRTGVDPNLEVNDGGADTKLWQEEREVWRKGSTDLGPHSSVHPRVFILKSSYKFHFNYTHNFGSLLCRFLVPRVGG